MLSNTSRPYIEASVPVLREHGLAITRHFYTQMFAAHPELKNVFNMAHQATGEQQGSLASAVFAYAANIDNAAALAPVVRRIAHKHASLGVTAAQYPIVGKHLLAAIRDVLGAAATPELLAAWDEAYQLLADALIAAEAELYREAAVEPGALRSLRVARVVQESSDVKSLYLQTDQAGSPGRFEPGQYVSVAAQAPRLGLRQLRQYSLSDAPARAYWRLTVKREAAREDRPEGEISSFLHTQVQPGDPLQVSAPFGDFVPLRAAKAQEPLTLLSAGAGITPLLSVLNTLADAGSSRAIWFAHAGRDEADAVFSDEIERARASLPGLSTSFFYEKAAARSRAHAGRMRLSAAPGFSQFAGGHFCLSGPRAFVQEQWRALIALGVSPVQIEREVFGPELFDHLA